MDSVKKAIYETEKSILGVASFLLCLFFFIFPLVQYIQDSSIAPTGWKIATIIFTPKTSDEIENIIEVETTDIDGNLIIEINDFDKIENINEIEIFNESIIEFEINNLIENTDKDEFNEIIIDTQVIMEEIIPKGNYANILVFLFLIIPIVYIVLLFSNISFLKLLIVPVIGLLLKITFIIIVYMQYGVYFIPTIFSWIILVIYMGLCTFAIYCYRAEKSKKKLKNAKPALNKR